MALIEINWQPTRSELRVFGLGLAMFCLVIGIILFRQDGNFGVIESLLAGIAVIAASVSFYAPGWLKRVYYVFMIVTFPLGWAISHLLLAVIFYALFTPIGLVMRLLGRDPMHRRRDPDATSYWVPHKKKDSRENYFRQF